MPWQQATAERLQRLLELGRLPHALLLTALQGWGERALTRWLALKLLDQDTDLEPTELAHPDLRWIVPDRAEIKVDAVRGLGDFAYGTPQLGLAKVIVFEDAHLLNRSAANALLKTLEEPPSGTYVLLSTSFPGRLLPTVLSRAQRFHVQPDGKSAQSWLEDQAHGNPDDLSARLFANGNAPLAVMEELAANSPALISVLSDVLDASEPLSKLDDLLALGPGRLTAGWYRYLVGLLAGQEHFPALTGLSRRRLLGFADELLWVRAQLLSTNSANARLLVGRLTSRWHQLARGVS